MTPKPTPDGPKRTDPRNAQSGLRGSELLELEKALRAERGVVLGRLGRHVAVGLDVDTDVGDEGDQAATELERSNSLRIAEKESNLLGEIDRALGKFVDGSYGVCEGTGEPIGLKRLQARPWARYSVEYKEQLERTERGYQR